MTTQAITINDCISARFQASNGSDSTRVYDITAEVTFGNGSVISISGGQVRQPGEELNVADFSSHGGPHISTSFYVEDRATVLAAIEDFVAALHARAATATISIA